MQRRIVEVMGSCSRCKDVFALDVEVRRDGQFLPRTPVVQQQGDQVIHRPDRCGGEVRLFA